ncbi:MAG: hypothetical protein IE913_06020 [Halothiobacillus sp.]|nr:hypothetical protein [Halothiobacillus sp.]
MLSSTANMLGLHDVFVWLSQRPLLMPHLAEPLWLGLLLVPLALFIWRWRARQKILNYADQPLQYWAMQRLSQASPTWGGRIRSRLIPFFWRLFWLSLALTLAGPQVMKAKNEQLATRPPVLFVVDDTAAMSVADVSPNRHSRATALLELLGQALNTHRLGLMIDDGEAGLLLPPTGDANLFAFYLKQLSHLAHPLAVPHPDRALEWTAQMPEMHGGVVVWLTSGDANSFQGALGSRELAAAQALKKADVRLIAVTVAGAGGPLLKEGVPLKDAQDQVITSQPAPQRVAELAKLTGGVATQTQTLPQDVAFIRKAVHAVPNRAPDKNSAKAQRSLHELPLMLAWLSLLALAALSLGLKPLNGFAARLIRPNRTKPPIAALILVAIHGALLVTLVFVPSGAWAADQLNHTNAAFMSRSAEDAEVAAGHRALKAGSYAEAQVAFSAAKGYAARFGAGLAAFRRADYAFAVDQLQMAVTLAHTPVQKAQAAFNLGDALTLAGRYAEARDAFTYVLSIKPLDETLTAAALTNRGIVQKMLQSFAKNGKNSPRFQGHQAAKYGYFKDPEKSRMDKEIQKSQGASAGSSQASTTGTQPITPFALNAATESSARSKLTLIHDAPAPLLDGLLRQQPYHLPTLTAPDKNQAMPAGVP